MKHIGNFVLENAPGLSTADSYMVIAISEYLHLSKREGILIRLKHEDHIVIPHISLSKDDIGCGFLESIMIRKQKIVLRSVRIK